MSTTGSSHQISESLNGRDQDQADAIHKLYIIAMVGQMGFLQLKYQPLNASPFDKHYALTFEFFAVMFFYISLRIAEIKLKTCNMDVYYHSTVSRFSHLFGAFASFLLLLITLPILGLILLSIWTIGFAWVAYISSKELYRRLVYNSATDTRPPV